MSNKRSQKDLTFERLEKDLRDMISFAFGLILSFIEDGKERT